MEKQEREQLAVEIIEEMKVEGFFSDEKLNVSVTYNTIRRFVEKIIEKVRAYHKTPEEAEKINGYDVYVGDILRKTVGKENMEEMNNGSNLFGLVDQLKKYALETEINDFLVRVDFLKNNLTPNTNDINLMNSLLESLKKVNEFLAKVHVKKLRSDLDNSIISNEEFDANLKDYFISLPKSIMINNVNYEILSLVELSQIIKPIINSSANQNDSDNLSISK